MQAVIIPYKPTHQQQIAIKRKLRDSNTAYIDIRKILPANLDENQAINILRKINHERVKEELKDRPKGYHKMPSTVQATETSWKNPITGKVISIKIVGFRHGMFNINYNTRPELIAEIDKQPNRILLTEQNLNRCFKIIAIDDPRNLKRINGYDIKDHDGYNSKIMGILSILTYILFPITLLILATIGIKRSIDKDQNGFLKHYNHYPKYGELIQSKIKQLPERIEIELHQKLPPEQAKKLDTGLYRHNILHGRSIYMAGYIAAIAEKMEHDNKPIVLACGGGHLPRIVSCLALGSRENIPPSFQEDFDKGYQKALKHMKTKPYLQSEFGTEDKVLTIRNHKPNNLKSAETTQTVPLKTREQSFTEKYIKETSSQQTVIAR